MCVMDECGPPTHMVWVFPRNDNSTVPQRVRTLPDQYHPDQIL